MADADLASWIVGKVSNWTMYRDGEHGDDWEEFYRLWRGIWNPRDRQRRAERSRAVMPALQAAIDNAVSDQIEATFSKERWFDAKDTDDPNVRRIIDKLLIDLFPIQQAVEEIYTLAAVYGTGIGKVMIVPPGEGTTASWSLRPLEPWEFVIDSGATSIEEAEGVAHVLYTPRNIVTARMESGFYEEVSFDDLGEMSFDMPRHTHESMPQDSTMVKLTEWHGLVPLEALERDEVPPEGSVGRLGDQAEAIVAVANDSKILRFSINPLGRDRAFVAYQHDTVPRRFWGRGLAEKGLWPQRVLDSEIRARIDALAFSSMPMMAVNAANAPRGESWEARPGRNIFVNGKVSDSIQPIQFPGPDDLTMAQQAAMERMIESATGQPSNPMQDISTHNAAASGISQVFGPAIRRSRRTLSNIERNFLGPMVDKFYKRFTVVRPQEYPRVDLRLQFHSALGMMAREVELQQVVQLAGLSEGFARSAFLKMVVENSSLSNKDPLINILNAQLMQSVEQSQQQDPGEVARVMSAQARQVEVQLRGQIAERDQQLKAMELKLIDEERQREHLRELMDLSIRSEQAEASKAKDESQALLNVTKSATETVNATAQRVSALKDMLEAIRPPPEPTSGPSAPAIDTSLLDRLERLLDRSEAPAEEQGEITVERDPGSGAVTRVGGRPVRRGTNGFIEALE